MKNVILVTALSTAVGALGAAGCSSDESTAGEDDTLTAEERCAVEDRAEDYSAGMAKTGKKGVTVELVESRPVLDQDRLGTPGPPSRHDNVWQLIVRDGEGNPLEEANVWVDTLMPDHGHASNRNSVVHPMGGGEYEVDPLNLMMNGYWEITVNVEKTETDLRDSVVFKFCVAG